MALVILTWAAHAGTALADDPAFIALSAGRYDVHDNRGATELRAEYRASKKLWVFRPIAGLMVNSDHAVYAYGGFGLDLYFGRRFVVLPSLAVGYYCKGDRKDLGHKLEFRSGAEFAYRFDNRSRIGIAFHHISNASISDNNPGAESLVLTYSIPLSPGTSD